MVLAVVNTLRICCLAEPLCKSYRSQTTKTNTYCFDLVKFQTKFWHDPSQLNGNLGLASCWNATRAWRCRP